MVLFFGPQIENNYPSRSVNLTIIPSTDAEQTRIGPTRQRQSGLEQWLARNYSIDSKIKYKINISFLTRACIVQESY
jgi:hypothetical protein